MRRRGRVEWRARVTRNGVTKTAIRRRRDDALEAERDLVDQLEGRSPETPAGPTFAEHWVDYFRDVATARNKPSTLDSKRAIFEHHLQPYFGAMRLAEIDEREVDRFRARMLAERAPKTTNNVLTVLRNALHVAARWGRIATVPRFEWARTQRPGFRFLDFDEADRLRSAAEPDGVAYAMITTALHTGMRLGELRALRWDAVNLETGALHVCRAVAVGVVGTPKSNRSRVVPLSRTAVEALRAVHHGTSGLVFPAPSGRMQTRKQAERVLRLAVQRAGIEHAGWHALRHTFASHLVMRGVALKVVQELLGHSTIEMTMRYAHLSPSVRRDAVAVLDRESREITLAGSR